MKRLIDEEDAIRAVCKNCYAEDGGDYKDCRYYPCDDVQAIEALPSTDVERIKAIMKKANEKDNEEHIGRPTDLISRADAIEAVVAWTVEDRPTEEMPTDLVDRLNALPSAEAEPTVIRSRTLMPTKDFMEWAKRIKEVNPNAVVIPCDAEVVSDEAVQGWIPCSERLPSESGDYLCTIPLDAEETYTEVLTFHKGKFYEADDEWGATYHDDVLAWMPLPKPYKGGDDE